MGEGWFRIVRAGWGSEDGLGSEDEPGSEDGGGRLVVEDEMSSG